MRENHIILYEVHANVGLQHNAKRKAIKNVGKLVQTLHNVHIVLAPFGLSSFYDVARRCFFIQLFVVITMSMIDPHACHSFIWMTRQRISFLDYFVGNMNLHPHELQGVYSVHVLRLVIHIMYSCHSFSTESHAVEQTYREGRVHR